VRTEANTVDVRGLRVHEADAAVEERLRGANGPVWVIHGIGTGKLKRGLCEWLAGVPYVERVSDAEQGDGGMGCWARVTGGWRAFDSSTGCRLPDNSVLSPVLPWWPSIAGRLSAPINTTAPASAASSRSRFIAGLRRQSWNAAYCSAAPAARCGVNQAAGPGPQNRGQAPGWRGHCGADLAAAASVCGVGWPRARG